MKQVCHAFVTALSVCLVFPIVSCGSTRHASVDRKETRGFAPVVSITQSEPIGLDLDELKFDPDAPGVDTSRAIRAEATIVRVSPHFLKSLGVQDGEAYPRVSKEIAEKILARAREDGTVLTRPFLTTFSGQKSHVLVVTQAAYIRDVGFKVNAEEPSGYELEPKIDVLNTGSVVELQLTALGDQVEVQHFRARQASLIGTRTCLATVGSEDIHEVVPWQEPVVLRAKSSDTLPGQLRVGKNELVLARLGYEVQQSVAGARAFVVGDFIEETYEPVEPPLSQSRISRANSECVVLLSVREIPAEELEEIERKAKEELEKSKKAGESSDRNPPA